MDVSQLQELVQRYHDNRKFITNEETTKMALIVPFIRALGYDPNVPKEVRLEYSADFTQGDGKRHQDRMDFAIFDSSGQKPLIVIEAKPLGTDLQSKSQQLARYIAQMPDLRFGIITDGCHYLFYGDLENRNQMDKKHFFNFSLDDPKLDFTAVAKELSKYSRDAFNAETLITEAENSRYRQAMIDSISRALKNPSDEDGFLKWLVANVYKGSRTASIMKRMGKIAKEAIKPSLMRVMSNDFIEELKAGLQRSIEAEEKVEQKTKVEDFTQGEPPAEEAPSEEKKSKIETTQEELEFYEAVKDICAKEGVNPEEIVYKDTVNYFNVSYQHKTKWFVRYFGDARRKCVVTWVPTEEAKLLCQDFEVEDAPAGFGVSRVYIDDIAKVWTIKSLITRSLEITRKLKDIETT